MRYIPQFQKNDCGFAALKMVLSHFLNEKNTFYLPNPKSDDGYSYFELIAYARQYGVRIEAYRFQNPSEIKKCSSFPYIITIKNKNDSLHAVVVTKRIGNHFRIFDPSKGKHWISFEKLLSLWDQTILVVEEWRPFHFEIKRLKAMNVWSRVLQTFFHAISSISLLCFIYFLEDNSYFIYPVTFLTIFVIFEIVFRIYSLHLMNQFDEKYLANSLYYSNSNFKASLKGLMDYKRIAIVYPLDYLLSFCTCVLIIIITALNNPYTLIISLSICSIFILDYFLIKPTLKEKKRSIEEKEEMLSIKDKEDFNSYKNQIKSLSSGASKLASLFLIRKYITWFIVAILCLLIMAVSNVASFNYLLFYYVIFIYFVECFEKVLSLQDIIKEYKIAKLIVINDYSHVPRSDKTNDSISK